MPQNTKALGSELDDQLGRATADFTEHYRLLDEMEHAGLPEQIDQDARDLHRLISEHAWRYKKTSHGDMTLPLVRSLHRLALAASKGPATTKG